MCPNAIQNNVQEENFLGIATKTKKYKIVYESILAII